VRFARESKCVVTHLALGTSSTILSADKYVSAVLIYGCFDSVIDNFLFDAQKFLRYADGRFVPYRNSTLIGYFFRLIKLINMLNKASNLTRKRPTLSRLRKKQKTLACTSVSFCGPCELSIHTSRPCKGILAGLGEVI